MSGGSGPEPFGQVSPDAAGMGAQSYLAFAIALGPASSRSPPAAFTISHSELPSSSASLQQLVEVGLGGRGRDCPQPDHGRIPWRSDSPCRSVAAGRIDHRPTRCEGCRADGEPRGMRNLEANPRVPSRKDNQKSETILFGPAPGRPRSSEPNRVSHHRSRRFRARSHHRNLPARRPGFMLLGALGIRVGAERITPVAGVPTLLAHGGGGALGKGHGSRPRKRRSGICGVVRDRPVRLRVGLRPLRTMARHGRLRRR